MDAAEKIIARKRISRWPREQQRELIELPAAEAQIVGLLVALLDARPADVVAET